MDVNECRAACTNMDIVGTGHTGAVARGLVLFLHSTKRSGIRTMKVLEDRIREEGLILSDTVLKVDSFLNHQVDTALALEIGKELAGRFADKQITKILTIEASGIQFAMAAGPAKELAKETV